MSLAGNKGKQAQSALLLSTAISLTFGGQVFAQDAPADSGASAPSMPSSSPDSGSSAGASSGGDDKPLTPVNPLKGLFQMQPQYPTPGKTQMFPEAVSPNMGKDSDVQGRNPGQTSSIFQQEFKDPYAKDDPDKKVTTVNPLKGLFQQQPQYPTPGTTQKFPEAVPDHLGKDSDVAGRSPGQKSETYQSEWKDPYAKDSEPTKDQSQYLKGLFQQQPHYISPNKTIKFPEVRESHLGGKDSEVPGRHPGQAGEAFKPEEPKAIEPEPEKTAEVGLPALPGQKKEEGEKKAEEKKEGEGEKKAEEKKEGEGEKKAEGEKKEGEKKAEGEKKEGEGEKKAEADKEKKSDEKKTDDKDKVAKEEEKKKEEEKPKQFNPLNEAAMLMNTGKLQDSVNFLNTLIKKSPKNPQAYYMRAVAHVRMRKYDLAAADYGEVLKLAPQGPLATMAKAGLTKIHF